MTVTYAPVFDVAAIRDGQTATEYAFSMTMFSAGLGNIAITDADFLALGDTRTHHDEYGILITTAVNHEGAAMFQDYLSSTFVSALSTIITAKMASVSPAWTGAITVGFSGDRITIARTSGSFSFTIAWGNAASSWLMGFSSAQSTPGTSFTGDLTPTYWIRSTQAGRSDDLENDFEPEEIADLAISDDATAFAGVSRSTSPKMRSWVQQFEPLASVYKASIAGTVRWTFEHLFEHCRCNYPFLVKDADDSMACVFTPAGAVWRGKRRAGGPSDNVHFHVPIVVWHAGDVSDGG